MNGGRVFVFVFIWVLTLLFLSVVGASQSAPVVVIHTTGDSMEPTYSAGEKHLCVDHGADEIDDGDVILFDHNHGTNVLHRVIDVSRENRTFVTQGDNRDVPDIRHPFTAYICHIDRS